MRRLCLIMLALALAGCAGGGAVLPAAPLDKAVLTSGERLGLSPPAPVDTGDWLLANEPMRAFVQARRLRGPIQGRVDTIVDALLTEIPGGFSYQADATLSASETFHAQRGNCLAFSAMLISLFREAGLRARFQRVEIAPGWEIRGDTSVSSQHINARVELPGVRHLVVDWTRRGTEMRRVEVIPDSEALAEYHNNLGAEALLAGDVAKGFAEIRRALELAPELPHLWSNLAVVYHRLQDPLAAEAAWLFALQRDATQAAALSGLQGLYERGGRRELAAQLQQALERERGEDPLYHYLRARRAAERGEWREARERLEAALALREDERFAQLLREVRAREAAAGAG